MESFVSKLNSCRQIADIIKKHRGSSNNIGIKRENTDPISEQSVRHGVYDPQNKCMRFNPVTHAAAKLDDCQTKQNLQRQEKMPSFVLTQNPNKKQQISCQVQQKFESGKNRQQQKEIPKEENNRKQQKQDHQINMLSSKNQDPEIDDKIISELKQNDKQELASTYTEPRINEEGDQGQTQKPQEYKGQNTSVDQTANDKTVQSKQRIKENVQSRVIDTNGPKKKVEKCKFFPFCKMQNQCKFLHPTQPCKFFPKCRFGLACKYIHPPCKYKIGCTRLGCIYVHPKIPSPKPKDLKGKYMIQNNGSSIQQRNRIQNQKYK